MKKVIALVLALAMVATLGLAFAEPETPAATKTITLTGGKAGHTYTLYQIFVGTVEEVDGAKELTNIQWGSDVTETFKNTKETAAAYAKEVATDNNARATAQALVAANALTGGTPLELSVDGNVVFDNLAEGYYMIVDTSDPSKVAAEGDYSSAYIVAVVENVTGKVKGSGSTSEKEVALKGTSTYQASASYDIGDAVPFKLSATTADNVASYKKYHITFQDTQSVGLDAPTSFTVNVLGKTFTVPATGDDPAAQTTDNGTKITVSKQTVTGKTFAIKVEFEPTGGATYLNAEGNSTTITVDYTSVLNANAEIGSTGNLNESNIKYSNNPEDEDGGDEGETPDDTVKVFTFKPVINKTDAQGNPLKGAQFTIYQEVAEGTTGAQTGAAIKAALLDPIEDSALTDAKYYKTFAMTVLADEVTFEFKGLADGNYVLVETAIPTGYNPFQSKAFTITSTVNASAPELLDLVASEPFTANEPTEGTFTGTLDATIQNQSGTQLPSTGGIGTTIFYILGGLLVIGAAVILVARRKAQD